MTKRKTKELQSVYMTAREVRELFHVCQKTVCRWREAGKIHGTKIGREYVYPLEEITALLNDSEAAKVREIMQARANSKRDKAGALINQG